MSEAAAEEEAAALPAWSVLFTRQAQKDSRNLAAAVLRPKAEALLGVLGVNPFQTPPTYEKLTGDLDGLYSRRINIQHWLVYQVDKEARMVKVLRMWTHYE